jgi:hypothetical protein
MGIHMITLYKLRKACRLQGELVPATLKDLRLGPADMFNVGLEAADLISTEIGA